MEYEPSGAEVAVICVAGPADCAVSSTPAMPAPEGSVNVPVNCALFVEDCGTAFELTARKRNAEARERTAKKFFMVPPLPHARELEVWPMPRGLALAADFAGLLAWRKGTLGRLPGQPRRLQSNRPEGRPLQGLRA